MTMKPMMATLRWFLVLIAAWVAAACGTPSGTVAVVAVGSVARNNARTLPAATVTVGIPRYSASPASSSLSAIAPLAVRLLPFNDDRKDLDIEGRSTAAFGVPMANLRFEPSAATLLGQAIVSELQAAGHTVTDHADGVQVTGAIMEFEAHTDTSLLYWDVTGNLAVSLQIAVARGAQPAAALDYRARCVERTYIWPGAAVIAAVMANCIKDFADRLRSDGRAANALGSASFGLGGRVDEARRDVATQAGAVTEKSYTHPEQRWSVSYPGDWTLEDKGRFVEFRRGRAILGIHTLAPVASRSLDEVADAVIQSWEQQMQKVNVVRRVARQRVSLAGDLSAIAVVHHIGTGQLGQIGQSRKLISVVKGRSFLIDAETHLASWPYNERDFDQIVGSFRVTP